METTARNLHQKRDRTASKAQQLDLRSHLTSRRGDRQLSELKKILVVDDEPDMLEIARICLEQVGNFVVHAAKSVQAALDILSDFQPDLILLDVVMPSINGLDGIPMFRRTFGGPIVMMSARVQPEEIAMYMDRGATAVIAKPFDVSALAPRISQILKSTEQA